MAKTDTNVKMRSALRAAMIAGFEKLKKEKSSEGEEEKGRLFLY